MKKLLIVPALAAAICLNAQSLSPQVIASSGSYFSNGSGSLSWTLGETMTETFIAGSSQLTQGFQQPDAVKVNINIQAFLSGPYNTASSQMDDGLRSGGYIPLIEPYTGLGFIHVGGGGESIAASVLSNTGNNAIIDWVFLELRNNLDDTDVLATRSALVQADGDIVDLDGTSAVEFNASPDDYYISVQHRNHLSIMSFSVIALGDAPVAVNFTDGSTATFGTGAQKDIGGTKALWSGDVIIDGIVKYAGGSNDRDPILVKIGGTVPTAIFLGYTQEDVTMDGTTKYAGLQNDRDPILVNIGGTIPTATLVEQMP
jgi:hypothetical protein